MDLSIIIINYNSYIYIQDCLNSIFQFTQNIDFETIVIDNNSTDRSIENLPSIFKKTQFYFKDNNNGFGAGCNFGIKISKGKYIAIVNPDIIIKNNVFHNLFIIMENNPDIGLCSPVFIDEKGKLTYTYNKFPNFRWEFLEFIGLDGTRKETTKLLSVLDNLSNKSIPFEVDTVTGACMFIRADVLEKTGLFDEKMFLYYEDTDIQKRITDAGYKIVCIPNLKVLHLENKSTRPEGADYYYYLHLFRSKLIYMKKHLNFFKRNFYRVMHIIGFSLRLFILIFRKKVRSKKREKMDLYKNILKIYFLNDSI